MAKGFSELHPEDSKHEFKSGATSSGKLPYYNCISEVFLTRLAQRMTLGAEKHGKFNYQKGLNDKEFIIDRLNHAFLHLIKAMNQINEGTIMADDDLAGVAANVMMAMEYQEANMQIREVVSEVKTETRKHSDGLDKAFNPL